MFQETITFSNASASGTWHRYGRGKDNRLTVDSGPLHTESGFVNGERWHQNENGHTVIELPERAPSGAEPTTITVSRVHAPVDAFMIATLTRSGIGRRDYFDPGTSYLIRQETTTVTGKVTSEFTDFKALGSRHLPTHWVERNERTNLRTTYERTEYREDDAGLPAVALPANRRTLLQFPPGAPSVSVPATLLSNGHWIVRVLVGDRGLDFFLDTGASGLFIDSDVAKELGLATFDESQDSNNAGRFKIAATVIPEMRIGSIVIADAVVRVGPLGSNERGDVKAVGVLGFDFLCEAGFTLDYEHGKVTATRTGNDVQPEKRGAIPLDIRLNAEQPYVTAVVNGVPADRMIIDTGGTGSMIFFNSFTQRHPTALPESDRLPGESRFWGIGGDFSAARYSVPSMRLGSIHFKDFEAYRVTTASAYSEGEDGILGPDLLKLFTVDLDYSHHRIYLTPNANFHGVKN